MSPRKMSAKKRGGAAPAPDGGVAPVDVSALAPNNSYGVPDFVARGFYRDLPFTCATCGKAQIWKATQQKWWYEVAKGFAYSTATQCRSCRQARWATKAEARRVSQEGLARKRASRRG